MRLTVVSKGKKMKILVPLKRVVDYNVRVRVNKEQSGMDLNNVKMSVNPFDEIALEEKYRKNKGPVEIKFPY